MPIFYYSHHFTQGMTSLKAFWFRPAILAQAIVAQPFCAQAMLAQAILAHLVSKVDLDYVYS